MIIANSVLKKVLAGNTVDTGNFENSLLKDLPAFESFTNELRQLDTKTCPEKIDFLLTWLKDLNKKNGFMKDTRQTQNLNRNELLLPYVEQLLPCCFSEDYRVLDESFIIHLVKLYAACGIHLTQTGKGIESEIPLRKAKAVIDQYLNQQKLPENLRMLSDNSWKNVTNTKESTVLNFQSDVIYSHLANNDPLLPIEYASLLYSLGRTYFYTHELEKKDEFISYLNLAKKLYAIRLSDIQTPESEKEKLELKLILCDRNGLLRFLLKSNDPDHLKLAEKEYETLSRKRLDDAYHQMICTHQLARICQQIAISSHLWERNTYYQKAMRHCSFLKYHVDQAVINSSSWGRTSAYYNTYGQLLYDKLNPQRNLLSARHFFEHSVKFELEKSNNSDYYDYPLADAYYYLALIERDENHRQEAKEYIDKCVELREKLYHPGDHRLQVAVMVQGDFDQEPKSPAFFNVCLPATCQEYQPPDDIIIPIDLSIEDPQPPTLSCLNHVYNFFKKPLPWMVLTGLTVTSQIFSIIKFTED